ncbi:hypothetical protein BDV93DRAFT_255735 [Ceratobasidium sp. AG-I]|nr:hypothetical protein BDV93DRAFT_255735 [Ceratobasidium sp. AG-I]
MTQWLQAFIGGPWTQLTSGRFSLAPPTLNHDPPTHTMPGDKHTSGGAPSGSGSGSGSGSSSGGSGGTVRPTAPAEATTFTFSSKRSPFIHNSPPGALTFVSPVRKDNDLSRDRQHRRQPGAAPAPSTRSEFSSDWIPLRPLKPVTEVSLPIFSPPKPGRSAMPGLEADANTAVFAARSVPDSHTSNARLSPRLSLVAQHYHATSRHPFFDAPPQLITPPPMDPFARLSKFDGYFPPMPPKTPSPSPSPSRHKSKSSSQTLFQGPPNTPSQSESKQRTPRASSSRTSSRAHTAKPSNTPRPTTRTPSIFLTGSQPPPTSSSTKHGKSPATLHPSHSHSHSQSLSQSQTATPRQLKSRTPKSQTPPDTNDKTPQPSITAFRDCFGMLTAAENVFPATRAGSHTQTRGRGGSGSEKQGSGSGSIVGVGSEFQRRWTRRWLRRTMRGVGSMGSGSTSGSGSAGSTGGTQSRSRSRPGSGSTMMQLKLTAGAQSTGSQDSLDRVRVSRSNAGSPSASRGDGQIPQEIEAGLSDVDEGEAGAENDAGSNSPPAVVGGLGMGSGGAEPGMGEGEKEADPTIDGGTCVQGMMENLTRDDLLESTLTTVPATPA